MPVAICTASAARSTSPSPVSAPFEGGDVVNKIYKQRMEDPEPLEREAQDVPAAFAAIVRKLMAKDPDERYQNGKELQADLTRWTDPDRVKAILGAEAESARAFRPPPPELDDEDLRLLDDEERPGSAPLISLRDLGDAEPGVAPLHRPPPPPRPPWSFPPRRLSTTTWTPCPARPPGRVTLAHSLRRGRLPSGSSCDRADCALWVIWVIGPRVAFGSGRLPILTRRSWLNPKESNAHDNLFWCGCHLVTARSSGRSGGNCAVAAHESGRGADSALSRERRQSVGQILRSLIDQALAGDESNDNLVLSPTSIHLYRKGLPANRDARDNEEE